MTVYDWPVVPWTLTRKLRRLLFWVMVVIVAGIAGTILGMWILLAVIQMRYGIG